MSDHDAVEQVITMAWRAQKLLIALWRYVDQAIVPEGARLKVTVA